MYVDQSVIVFLFILLTLPLLAFKGKSKLLISDFLFFAIISWSFINFLYLVENFEIVVDTDLRRYFDYCEIYKNQEGFLEAIFSLRFEPIFASVSYSMCSYLDSKTYLISIYMFISVLSLFLFYRQSIIHKSLFLFLFSIIGYSGVMRFFLIPVVVYGIMRGSNRALPLSVTSMLSLWHYSSLSLVFIRKLNIRVLFFAGGLISVIFAILFYYNPYVQRIFYSISFGFDYKILFLLGLVWSIFRFQFWFIPVIIFSMLDSFGRVADLLFFIFASFLLHFNKKSSILFQAALLFLSGFFIFLRY
jgi:hypothetical protein